MQCGISAFGFGNLNVNIHNHEHHVFRAAPSDLKRHVRSMFNALSNVRHERAANEYETEQKLRNQFHRLFNQTGSYLAEENFQGVLREKSGKNHFRNDGSINWYHEAIPIMTVLALLKMGKRKGGLDESDLEPYGGFDVVAGTHWRHDSVEDHVESDRLRRQVQGMRGEISIEHPEDNAQMTALKARMIIRNVNLMSQQRLFDEKGEPVIDPKTKKHLKEDTRVYTRRLADPEESNPVVFMLKQTDIIHNLATMFRAPKFTPELRKKRCNEREDMYGARIGFTDKAKRQWPEFKNAINTLDCIMGVLLYTHFRYLESVDLAYPEKMPTDDPVGITRYLPRAMALEMPEGFHPIHIFMKRMAGSVDPAADPEKFKRLQNFMEKVVKPALAGYEDKFGYLFPERCAQPKNDNGPRPVAI